MNVLEDKQTPFAPTWNYKLEVVVDDVETIILEEIFNENQEEILELLLLEGDGYIGDYYQRHYAKVVNGISGKSYC